MALLTETLVPVVQLWEPVCVSNGWLISDAD